jgi:integrase
MPTAVPHSGASQLRLPISAPSAPPASGRAELADTIERGLRYRLTAKGRSSWSVLTTDKHGRQCRITLGDGSIPLAKARELAVLARADLTTGINPTAQKRERKQAARADREAMDAKASVPSVEQTAARWRDEIGRDMSKRYQAEMAGLLRRAMGTDMFSAVPIDQIDCDTFGQIVSAARDRGNGEGRHLLAISRTLFGWARRKGILLSNIVATWLDAQRDGRRMLPRWTAQPSRERVLSDDELTRVWRTMDDDEYTASQRAFVRMLIVSACRAGEIANLNWEDIRMTEGLI